MKSAKKMDPAVKPRDDTATPRDDTATPRDDTATPRDDTATPRDDTATPRDDTATPRDDTATSMSSRGSTAGSSSGLNFNLKIWRQKNPEEKGHFVSYRLENINPDMSFLEMLDVLNQKLIQENQEPVAFEHDCREGICGSCSMVIDGNAHGPKKSTTTCQLYMRHYKNEDHITIEPFRARAFPVVKDLVVNRKSFDRIIKAGGYITVNTGSAPDGNVIPVPKEKAELSFDAAACIGCGACVAACPNGAAMLFVSAKVSHLSLLPQGTPERTERVAKMVFQMDEEDFGSCTVIGSCAAACPKDISLENIARMNREFLRSMVVNRKSH